MENKQTTQNGTAGAVRTARARALDVAYVGMAAAVLAIVPIVVLFLVLQKYIMTGLSKASMK